MPLPAEITTDGLVPLDTGDLSVLHWLVQYGGMAMLPLIPHISQALVAAVGDFTECQQQALKVKTGQASLTVMQNPQPSLQYFVCTKRSAIDTLSQSFVSHRVLWFAVLRSRLRDMMPDTPLQYDY